MFPTGTRFVLEELRLRPKLPAAVSTSPTVKAIASMVVSSLMVWLAILPIVGGSLTGVTTRVNVLLAVAPSPSVTITVIVLVPYWLRAGVTVTVRLPPLPPKTMFPTGTRFVLEELRLRPQAPLPPSPHRSP